jgi:HAD superfamily hydrolase (TIGR01490 family)
MSPAVVFFDLDGTLVIGNTQLLLVKFLRERKVVGSIFVIGSALWFLGYKAGLLKVTEAARARGASMLRGLSVAQVEVLMNDLVDEILLPRMHPAALAALRGHQEAGDRLVVLSAALDPVVAALCGYLGVDDYVGAPCEVVGGHYSGGLSGRTPYGEYKVELAEGFMRRWGSDPEQCWAYADHTTDIGLLRCVGHAVAVNPKPGLERAASEAGWPILT